MARHLRIARGSGIRKVTVPDLSSLTKSESESLLSSLGLAYSSSSSNTETSGLNNKIKSQSQQSGSVVNIGSSISFEYYAYVAPPYFPYFPSFTPYPNIGSVIAYGTGAGQAWTQNEAYVTWGGSGWGSYTVIASNGSSSNSSSSAGGPPVLLSGFSAGTNYSVTVTLYANANYSGSSASSSTSFTTAAAPAPDFTPAPPDFTPVPPDFTPVPPDFTPVPPDFTPVPPYFPYFGGSKGPVPTPPDFTPAPPDFTPVPPDFTPAPPYFPYFKGGKGPGCIYADTRVLTVNGYVAARDIVVGDKLATLSPAGLTGDTILNASTDLAVALVDVEVLSVEHSVKDVVGFNNAPALYSAAQPIIIDVDGKFAYTRVGDIAVGDTIVSVDVNSGLISNTLVESIQTQSSQDVYDIRTTPYQWYITEDNMVIS